MSYTQNTANISGGIYYYQQPNAQMDYAGTKIWWGGNWRNSSGRSEVYLCTLPANWPTDLGGTTSGDTTPPSASGYSPAKGAVNVSSTTSISFHLSDTQSGVNLAYTILKVERDYRL